MCFVEKYVDSYNIKREKCNIYISNKMQNGICQNSASGNGMWNVFHLYYHSSFIFLDCRFNIIWCVGFKYTYHTYTAWVLFYVSLL